MFYLFCQILHPCARIYTDFCSEKNPCTMSKQSFLYVYLVVLGAALFYFLVRFIQRITDIT